MPHTCPTQNQRHQSNSRCGCPCTDCLIGARNDLADELVDIGKAFEEKLKKLHQDYKQELDDLKRKLSQRG